MADQIFEVVDLPLEEGQSFVGEDDLLEVVDHPKEGEQKSPCLAQEVEQEQIPPFLVRHLLTFPSTHHLCLSSCLPSYNPHLPLPNFHLSLRGASPPSAEHPTAHASPCLPSSG